MADPQCWLLVSFDQWRGDWLQQPWLNLPCLQRFARSAWQAPRCHPASPMCVPSRASLLTGLRPRDAGVDHLDDFRMPANAPSFVRDLRDAGYATHLIGKTHWTPHGRPCDLRDDLPLMHALGFDRVREIAGPRALCRVRCELTDLWERAGVMQAYRDDLEDRYRANRAEVVRPTVLPDELYPDIWVGTEARKELAAMPADRPWLLWVSFPGPHEPFDTPASWAGRGSRGNIPPPLPRPADALDHAPAGSHLRRKLDRWPDGIDDDVIDAIRGDYADHLALLDDQLEGLLDTLSQRSDRQRVAVSVISDHGELLGDWGLLLKGCFLDGAVRSLCLHRPPDGCPTPRSADASTPVPLTEAVWRIARHVRDGGDADGLNDPWGPCECELGNERVRFECGGAVAMPGSRDGARGLGPRIIGRIKRHLT